MQLLCESMLFLDQSMESPAYQPFAGGSVGVFSTRCPDKETANEDAAAVIPVDDESGVLVVADGLGGSAAGERAAALAIERIEAAVCGVLDSETMLRTAIINGIEQANQAIQDLGLGAATTLAIVEVNRRHVRPYHVGDSTILLTGGRGKVKFQSIMHSPVGYGLEAGLLDEHEAVHHDERHIVSNVVGSSTMRIEIGPMLPMAARDTLVVASDGLSDNLLPQEIVHSVRRGRIELAMDDLIHEARERMSHPKPDVPYKPDDLTVVVYRPNASHSAGLAAISCR